MVYTVAPFDKEGCVVGSKSPETFSISEIADAVERALRALDGPMRLRLQTIKVTPTWSAGGGEEMLTARVSVDLLLLTKSE